MLKCLLGMKCNMCDIALRRTQQLLSITNNEEKMLDVSGNRGVVTGFYAHKHNSGFRVQFLL